MRVRDGEQRLPLQGAAASLLRELRVKSCIALGPFEHGIEGEANGRMGVVPNGVEILVGDGLVEVGEVQPNASPKPRGVIFRQKLVGGCR